MINTVPKTTVLTEPLTPIEVKPVNISLDLDTSGSVVFSGYIRVSLSHSLQEPFP